MLSQTRLQTEYVLFTIVVLVLAIVMSFSDLGTPAIFIWDEAIYANNALDMHDTGDLLVLRRNGDYTLYNTKPPMGIWMQALSLCAFDISEFAIRFPSALSVVLICLMLLIFARRSLGDMRIGIIAVMVLVSSFGFMKPHVARSGDLDAMLTLWTTFYTLVVLHFLLDRTQSYRKVLLLAGAGMIAAFYTKSVAGFLPLLGLTLAGLYSGKLKTILFDRRTYIAIGSIVATCLLYYVVREMVLPGYLGHTSRSEYARFYKDIMPWHNQPFYYYFKNFVTQKLFTPYIWVLPFAIVVGILRKSTQRATMMLIILAGGFLLTISIPPNKLLWYDAPVYPWFALLIGIGATGISDLADKWITGSTKYVFTCILLILLFPAYTIYEQNAERKAPADKLEYEGFTMRQLKHDMPQVIDYTLFMQVKTRAHWTQADFYRNAFNRHSGYNILLKDTIKQLEVGETVLCCQKEALDSIQNIYTTSRVFENALGCQLIEITSRRPSSVD